MIFLWWPQYKNISYEIHFADNIFKHIFLNENILILIKLSLKCVAKGPINILAFG